MQIGDIVRVRNIRTYGAFPGNYFEWRPDNEKARDLKRVFVCLVLGTEGFELINKKGKQVMAALNVHRALNRLGWWNEEQIEKASGPKSGPRLVEKLRKKAEAPNTRNESIKQDTES